MNELVEVRLDGTARPLGSRPRDYRWPRYSPDGNKIAVMIREPDTTGIWLFDVASKSLERLTPATDGAHDSPLWKPDGESLSFWRRRGWSWQYLEKRIGAAGEPTELLSNDSVLIPTGWIGQTGRLLGKETESPEAEAREGARDPNPQIVHWDAQDPTDFGVLVPRISGVEMHSPTASPDGRMVAYLSRLSFHGAIYVTSFPGSGESKLVAGNVGGHPIWSPDSRQLFFVRPWSILEDQFMAVAEILDPETLAFSAPRDLFGRDSVRWETIGWGTTNWDMHPDGESFVMTRAVGEPPPPRGERELRHSEYHECRRDGPFDCDLR